MCGLERLAIGASDASSRTARRAIQRQRDVRGRVMPAHQQSPHDSWSNGCQSGEIAKSLLMGGWRVLDIIIDQRRKKCLSCTRSPAERRCAQRWHHASEQTPRELTACRAPVASLDEASEEARNAALHGARCCAKVGQLASRRTAWLLFAAVACSARSPRAQPRPASCTAPLRRLAQITKHTRRLDGEKPLCGRARAGPRGLPTLTHAPGS